MSRSPKHFIQIKLKKNGRAGLLADIKRGVHLSPTRNISLAQHSYRPANHMMPRMRARGRSGNRFGGSRAGLLQDIQRQNYIRPGDFLRPSALIRTV